MRKLLNVLIFLLVVAGLFVFTRNLIAQSALVRGVKAITGLDAAVGSVHLGLRKPYLQVSELRVANPSGFMEPTMAEIPEIYVGYDLKALLKGKTHLPELRLDLRELDVVRTSANKVNINTLKALMPQGGGKPPEILIDRLHLKIGKVVYKDYVLGNPSVREFNVNIDEEFKDVNNPNSLVNLIVFKALSKTDIPGLAGIDLGKLQADLKGIAVNQLRETFQGAEQKIKDILQRQ